MGGNDGKEEYSITGESLQKCIMRIACKNITYSSVHSKWTLHENAYMFSCKV